MFTGEPSAAEDAVDWLAALETNMYSSMTSRDNANLFSTKLFPKSPAKRWFNGLPDEVRRRWHLLKPEFESRWCTSTTPGLVALLSTDTTPVSTPAKPPASATAIPAIISSSVSLTSPATTLPNSKRPPTNANIPSGVHLAKETFDRMLKDSYQDGFADATDKLKAEYDEELQRTIADIFERAQERRDEDYVHAFELGRTSGIQMEREYQDSTRKPQITVGIQVDLPLDDDIFFTPTVVEIPLPIATSETASQTTPPAALIPLPAPTSSHLLAPVSHTSTLMIPSPSASSSIPPLSPKLSWADDSTSLPIIPLIKSPRDLSCLRTENKPFGTLRHRTRRRYQTARRVPIPPIHFPSPHTKTSASAFPFPLRQHRLHSYARHAPAPHSKTAPFLPPALDWDRDPRLFELSRVLRSLGWSHSLPLRP
jgi:hypothetical protein